MQLVSLCILNNKVGNSIITTNSMQCNGHIHVKYASTKPELSIA